MNDSIDNRVDIEKKDTSFLEVESKKTNDVGEGYAWVIVLCSFLLNFSTWGVIQSFGVFFSHYLNENSFANATKVDYAFIGGIAFGLGITFSTVINYIQGLIGTRSLMLIGNCLQFTGLMLASFSTKLWHLYLTQGLIQSFGLACMSLPAMTLVSQWFTKRRVLANLIAVSGSGVGGLVFTLSMQRVISVSSVHWALRAEAIISSSLALIAIILTRTRSKHHQVEFTLYDIQCLKCAGFWLLCFYLVTCTFAYVIILYTLPNFTTTLGYTAREGSIVGAMTQVGFCIGRPLAGYISDKIGPTTVTSFSYYVSAILAFAIWIPARNLATAIAFALLEGIFMGTVFPTIASIIVRLVGISKLNVAFCTLWIFLAIAGIFSEVIGVSMTSGDHGKNDTTVYRHTAIFAGLSFFACASSMLLLRGYIIARDIIAEEKGELESTNLLHIKVNPLSAVRCCFKWTTKRA